VRLDDCVAASLAGGFGMWLMLFPASVTRFYRFFHRREVFIPSKVLLRVLGALWLILVGLVLWIQ